MIVTRIKTRPLVRNSAFNLVSQGIAVLTGLVCVPIAFRNLGTERFGLLTLMWSLLSYAIVFDLGTGPSVSRATAASLVHDEGSRIAAIVRAGMIIQLALGGAAMLIIIGFAPIILHLLNVPAQFLLDGRHALYALALCLPVVLLTQSQQGALEGLERFDLLAYVRTPIQMGNYLFPAIGALAGWSLAAIMFAIFAARLIAAGVMYALYASGLPERQQGSARAELPALFRYGRWLSVSGVLTQLLTYVDRFLLSGMRGLNAVAQYGAPYDAATKLLQLPGAIGVAMFPKLAKDAARGQFAEAAATARKAMRVTLLVLVPLGALLIVTASPILHLWLGPKLTNEGVTAFRILVLATLFHAVAYSPAILTEACGRSDVMARYQAAEVVVYIPIVIVAISRYGVAGAAWAWALRTFALMLFFTWFAKRYAETR